MRRPSLAREEVINRLTQAFRQYGYEGATLSHLSKATGLKRASLYHFFPGGKEDMANVVLDSVGAWLSESVIAPLKSAAPPRDRLTAMMKHVDKFYAGGGLNCLIGLFVLGAPHTIFHKKIKSAIQSWQQALSQTAIDAGVKPTLARRRAEEWLSHLQGSLILTRGLDDQGIFRRMLEKLPHFLLGKEAT